MRHSLGAPRPSSLIVCLLPLLSAFLALRSESAVKAKELDPAAWGGDHVGAPRPQFTSGDECLFCHRNDVGPRWKDNRHNMTIRELPEARSDGAQFLMGSGRRTRFLKRGEAYGTLELLMAKLMKWDAQKFGAQCSGCHTSGVNSKAQTFAALAVECYMCHGVVPAKHATERGSALLARTRKDDARVAVSICGSCHLRGGKSRSSGRPYANDFVAGDNLFRDFKVEMTPPQIAKLHPDDRHVYENVRSVTVLGREEVTCLSCHEVHQQSSAKHRRLPLSPACVQCHDARSFKVKYDSSSVHSTTCEY